MGTTIENIKNLADWYSSEEQSARGESAEVSKKTNESITEKLEIGGLSLTTTDEYLWSGGGRAQDADGNYIIAKVSAYNGGFRSSYWWSDSDRRKVNALDSIINTINNWYTINANDYFKDNGYILDDFTVGNVLPFGYADLSCVYTKTAGSYDNYFRYIPMGSYPRIILNSVEYEINRGWGFGNLGADAIRQYAWINNETHFGVIVKTRPLDTEEHYDYYSTVYSYGIYLIEKTSQLMNWLGTDYKTEKGFIANSPIYGPGGVAQGLEGIIDTLTSDINVPLKPNKGVTGTGFVNIYAVGNNDLTNFGREMFSDVDIDFNDAVMTSEEFTSFVNTNLNLAGVTLAQVPQEVVEESLGKEITVGMSLTSIFKLLKASVKNFFSSQLIKYVLSVHVIPVAPNIGTRERINVGYKTFTQEADRIITDYVDYDCGTITIPSKYKNFLDYTATHCKIYIPFVGFVDINPRYVYDQTIGLKYRFSVIDGTCIAFLTTTGLSGNTSVIGTYSGSCCVHIPFTGENYATLMSGLVQSIGGVASGIATANPMLAIGGAINGAGTLANGMAGTELGSPTMNSSASFMGIRKPYIVIERPIPQLPPLYFENHGGVAQIVQKIGDCGGFTKCRDVIIPSTIPANIADRIKTKLETGVII